MWSFPVIAILKAPPGVVPAFPLPQLAFGGTLWQPGDPAERFGFNMKQISTGAGLLGLGVCMVATAFIATHRSGGEAFAQGTGTDRRIVSAAVLKSDGNLVAYRIWSDNAIDVRLLGYYTWTGSYTGWVPTPDNWPSKAWVTADNGTSGFRPLTDVDMSGEVDGGDISTILLDWNQRSDDLPPPTIDCTINAPR
jgi:hypothetical protein